MFGGHQIGLKNHKLIINRGYKNKNRKYEG
jgi:hypothetical protein